MAQINLGLNPQTWLEALGGSHPFAGFQPQTFPNPLANFAQTLQGLAAQMQAQKAAQQKAQIAQLEGQSKDQLNQAQIQEALSRAGLSDSQAQDLMGKLGIAQQELPGKIAYQEAQTGKLGADTAKLQSETDLAQKQMSDRQQALQAIQKIYDPNGDFADASDEDKYSAAYPHLLMFDPKASGAVTNTLGVITGDNDSGPSAKSAKGPALPKYQYYVQGNDIIAVNPNNPNDIQRRPLPAGAPAIPPGAGGQPPLNNGGTGTSPTSTPPQLPANLGDAGNTPPEPIVKMGAKESNPLTGYRTVLAPFNKLQEDYNGWAE